MQEYNMTDRVRQEVGIHSRLKHPSILELYTFFEDNNYVYIVLELAHNGTLHKYMSEHQMPLNEMDAANIITQVVNGLIYLQSNNIMHRDISMSNLLLTANMQVRISDFGLATQISQLYENKHMTLCGTPNYISPEVALRSSHGLKTDNWSLGCLLFTLLVGRPPFDKNGIKSTLTQVVIGNYHIPNHISTEAKDLINRLLCKDQAKRIELHQVVTHPFLVKNINSFNSNSMDSGIATFSSTKSIRSRSMEILSNPVEQQQEQIIGSASMYRCMSSINISKPSYQITSIQSQLSMPILSSRKLEVPPLNSIRLQPTRNQMKNVVLNILEDPKHEVVLEFLKQKSKEERVVDVLRISQDGLRIIMYQPNKGRGIRLQNKPPNVPIDGADHIYSYENLPEKHWKKYMYAHRFIQMVRAKTPKVTFYSEHGKCQLMESLEDFEMVLYKGGTVTKRNGNPCELNGGSRQENNNITQHAEKCYEHCVKIEQILSQTLLENPSFPVIIGRRPAEQTEMLKEISYGNNTFNNYISSSQTPLRTPKITMPSFSVDQTPSPVHSRYPESPITPHHHAAYQQKTVIPNIGHAALLSDGTFEINYNDGTRVVVLTQEQGGGILFSSTTMGKLHQPIRYNENDLMPDIVRIKFNQLPNILSHLKQRDAEFVTSTPLQQQNYNPVFQSNRLNHMKFMR